MRSNKANTYIWNTISSLLNAGMSAFMLLVVNRVCGPQTAGVFALAFSVAQLMMTIGSFEVRPYQVTDMEGKYSSNDYYNFKLVTCIAMLSGSAVYSLFKGYQGEKLVLVLLLCVFKMLETFEDYYVALYQRENKLGEGAKRSAIRVGSSLIVFGIVLLLTKEIYVSIVGTIIVTVLFIFIYFVKEENQKRNLGFGLTYKSLKGIAIACFPMFLGAYMLLYVGNAPKYAIDELLGEEFQTIYGIIYMPSFVINLISGFLFKPIVTDMANFYHTDKKQYAHLVFKALLMVTGISIVVMIAGYFCGLPVLGFVYGIDLSDYRAAFMLLLLGGMLGTFSVVLYYIMMIKRIQKWLLVSYVVTALAAMVLSNPLVGRKGLTGAGFAYFIYNAMRILAILITMYVVEKKQRKSV